MRAIFDLDLFSESDSELRPSLEVIEGPIKTQLNNELEAIVELIRPIRVRRKTWKVREGE